MPNRETADFVEVGRKIDFLMNVTNMRNAQLARALNLDASYVSRIRAGKRGLPTKLPFIEPAAEFFARNVHEGYQADTLARETGVRGGWPTEKGKAARLIARWLEGEIGASGRDARDAAADGAGHADGERALSSDHTAKARLYFGEQGRREAALAFLERIAAEGRPCELLLQSDEDTAWMYGEPGFAGQWARLMARLAQASCTFTVVRTISRDGNEMWEGVREWLPLYLTGAIRSYYYPRLRDGVRMRSLFVARETCALVSNSVQGMGNVALSILLDDADAASALEREFDAYLALCRPLAQVDRLESQAELEALVEGYRDAGDVVSAEVSGATVCVCEGRGALVASPGEYPVVYRIDEPRLVEAIAGYIGFRRDIKG